MLWLKSPACSGDPNISEPHIQLIEGNFQHLAHSMLLEYMLGDGIFLGHSMFTTSTVLNHLGFFGASTASIHWSKVLLQPVFVGARGEEVGAIVGQCIAWFDLVEVKVSNSCLSRVSRAFGVMISL